MKFAGAVCLGAVGMVLLAAAPGARSESGVRAVVGPGASLEGRRPFPDDNPWNQDVSGEPVDPNSARLIRSIGLDAGLHADFGEGFGNPYVVVDGTQPKVPVAFVNYPNESDPGPYPIPPDAPVEPGNDRHLIVVDRENWQLFELYGARKQGRGWAAACGAVFDLNSNRLRPTRHSSADAAGLPIFPGLVRYDEACEQGEIRHALRFTVSRTRHAFVHPARHCAGSSRDPSLPPMGMRVRLKADYDLSAFPPCAQAILKALKTYGMFVADNGSNWYLSGAPDPRWDSDLLRTLSRVKGRHFEVVRMGPVEEGRG
jgi:hypothetical protein